MSGKGGYRQIHHARRWPWRWLRWPPGAAGRSGGTPGIAQLFRRAAAVSTRKSRSLADGGGQVNALAIDIEAAFLEYLDMSYNLGLRRLRDGAASALSSSPTPSRRACATCC